MTSKRLRLIEQREKKHATAIIEAIRWCINENKAIREFYIYECEYNDFVQVLVKTYNNAIENAIYDTYVLKIDLNATNFKCRVANVRKINEEK